MSVKINLTYWTLELTIMMAMIVGTTVPLYLRTDYKIPISLNSMQAEVHGCLDSMRTETNANLQAIREEMKDLHGRLCAIEERNRR